MDTTVEGPGPLFATVQRSKSLFSQISTNKSAGVKCQFCLECFDLLDIFNHPNGLSTFAAVNVTNEDSGICNGSFSSRDRSSSIGDRRCASIGRTYIVKDNINPQFHEKGFVINDVVLDSGTVSIQIFALHPANEMPVCIGVAVVSIREMLRSDTVVKKLRIGASEKGTVVIFMKAKKENKYQHMDDLAEYCSISDIIPEEQISYNEQDYKNSFFKDILGNIDRQRYHFNLRPHVQRSLRVSEEMFEVATSFNIPALYIRLLCEREHSNMLVLKGMNQGFSEEVSSITAVSRASKIAQYREELSQLGQCSKHSFKKSEWKGHSECKWAPVNLHAQVLDVCSTDQTTQIQGSRHQYCLMAVGATSAHWDKFKNGGLLSLLGKSRDGDKFSERREFYKVLQRVEAILDLYAAEGADTRVVEDIVSDLLSLSNEPAVRSALEGLQNTLNTEKQLAIMNLSADIEKIVKNITGTSETEETLSTVCREYCLHAQRAIVWSIAQLELDNREHFLNLLTRYEACFSQLLSSVIASFIVNLCFRSRDPILFKQLEDLLVPIMWESLLSTHGDEAGMLEDMVFVMHHLTDITVQVEAISEGDQVHVSRVTGTQFAVHVVVAVPLELLEVLPESVQSKGIVKFTPLFFSHGINEQQTIAYKISETGLQDRVCEQFLKDLQSYIDAYVTPNAHIYNFKADSSIESSMEKLQSLHKITKRAKCSDFIVLAEQIGRDLGCMRFTTCKSAKDRTSMSLTYEYCCILCREHGFEQDDIPPVLEQFRRDGTRYQNTFKNIGTYKYCFNKLQCKMLPAVYKPPSGTFGDGALQT